MTYKVRTPLWFTALLVFGMLGFSVISLALFRATGDGFSDLFAIGGVLGATVAVLLRNMAILEIEPDRIVSRLQSRTVITELHAGDRLSLEDGRLHVVRADGDREPVQVNTILVRVSDWVGLQAAIEHRWPAQPQP
ncbi:hypothetical protein GCM10027447_17720 [Glycomyces halotolerans]